MSYQIFYGEAVAMLDWDQRRVSGISTERCSTEHQALGRAREILDQDFSKVVVIRDRAGNQLSGVRLQLRLGYCGVD